MLTTIQTLVGSISNVLVSKIAEAGYPALTDGAILLGRQHVYTQGSPPRVIMYPTDSVYGPRDPASDSRVATNQRYATDGKAEILNRSIGTDGIVFMVHCWGWQYDQSEPATVPDGNFDFTRILAHAVLQSIQAIMPGNPVVMGGAGHWPGSEPGATQLDVFGREFVFKTNPIPTPILQEMLKFVPDGTKQFTRTYINIPSYTDTPSTSELVFTDPPP